MVRCQLNSRTNKKSTRRARVCAFIDSFIIRRVHPIEENSPASSVSSSAEERDIVIVSTSSTISYRAARGGSGGGRRLEGSHAGRVYRRIVLFASMLKIRNRRQFNIFQTTEIAVVGIQLQGCKVKPLMRGNLIRKLATLGVVVDSYVQR